ncbi:MAG TPA: SCO family protein [Blastocatellia bacterium]|nr:SCO family protein [Blastocatellia bacterium]
MSDLSRRRLLSMIGLAPLAGSVLSAGSALAAPGRRSARSFGDAKPQSQASARESIHRRYFPDVTLVTQDGKRVRFYEDLVKDKIVTFNFFYAKCEGICPLVTTNLVQVQKLLGNQVGRDIFMYSFTLKPEEDTPAVLSDYRQMHQIGPGWTLLTGKPDDIEKVRRGLGFTYPNKQIDQDKSQHIGNIRYGNEPLMLWSACPGMAHPKWIAESISWVVRKDKA